MGTLFRYHESTGTERIASQIRVPERRIGNGMKKDGGKRLIVNAVLICLLAGQALTACGSKNQEPVVAEKTEAAAGESGTENESRGENGSGGADRAESGIGSADGTENGIGNAGEAEHGGENGSSGRELDSLIEAPGRYCAEVKGKRTRLSADAPVLVPDLEKIPVCRAEKKPYSHEEYEHFKKLLAGAAGCEWGEDYQEGDWGTACQSTDEAYHLSFADGAEEGRVPILWMHHRFISAGSSAVFDSKDVSGMDFSEAERQKLQQELEGKAEAFLKAMGDGDFTLYRWEWRALQGREKDGREAAVTGKYGLLLRYGRLQQGVTAAGSETALIGEAAPRAQYVDFLYSSDGTLLLVKNIGRETVTRVVDEDPFLLPFAAVAQIFEQYGKTYFDNESHVPEANAGQLMPAAAAHKEAEAEVRVNSVRLEYRYEQEAEAGKGTLIPVWNFYGSVENGFGTDGEGEFVLMEDGPGTGAKGLLVSINAEDGTIYGN